MSQFFVSSNSPHNRDILRRVKGCVQIFSELNFATGYIRWPLSQKTERDPHLCSFIAYEGTHMFQNLITLSAPHSARS